MSKDEVQDRLLPCFQVRTKSGVEFHLDEGGSRLAEVVANPLPEEDRDEPVCVYYKCLRGDSENLDLTEPDSFAVEDSKGRNWICWPVTKDDVERLTLLDHVVDVMQANAALKRQGISSKGTEIRVYFCQNEAELQEKLGQKIKAGQDGLIEEPEVILKNRQSP